MTAERPKEPFVEVVDYHGTYKFRIDGKVYWLENIPWAGEKRGLKESMEYYADSINKAYQAALDRQTKELMDCLEDLVDIADDYDGARTIEGLKSLVDEMRDLAKSRKPFPRDTVAKVAKGTP